MTYPTGKVYILGAGPGAVEFLTVAGQRLLSKAEVLIYDALIDPKLLSLTSNQCIQVWVGKRGQAPSTSQTDINDLLVAYCRQGKQVVRLKSGDPAFFGRLAAEVAALQAAHCPYEVWPGLSSALAAPLLAGIPLTDPHRSRSVMIVSAHDPSICDWDLMARCETLVILMGGRSLPHILQALQAQGKAATTPIAIIKWGGWPQQQVWVGTLATILSQTQGERLSPTVMVIGSVVSQRDTLCLSNPLLPPDRLSTAMLEFPNPPSGRPSLPLAGRTILVTRAAQQAPSFRQGLEAQGATVLEMAALDIGPPTSWDALDQAIAHLETFHWLILTSANGVQYFLERLLAQGKDTRHLATLKIAVVGRKTATSLEAWGLRPDYIPPRYIADELVANFPESDRLSEIRCLFPRVESGGREVLVQELLAQGATVTEVPAYESRCPTHLDPQILAALQAQEVEVVTFASSKTVEHFWQLLHQTAEMDWRSHLETLRIASIGPQTSQTCRTLLGRVDIEAQEYTLDGLVQSIVNFYKDAALPQ